MKKIFIIIIIIILLILAFFFAWRLKKGTFDLPNGETKELTVMIDQEGVIVEPTMLNIDEPIVEKHTNTKDADIEINNKEKLTAITIMETDGVKHFVPLDQIVGGGPPKDGIPPIDNPKYISLLQADEFLENSDPGISVDIDGVQRFYPFQILVWHEIVNDTINGKRVLITYCPLCLSGIVFEPEVLGESVEFGTSGKLWNSNLVMYDRKTESLWSQILGQAIVGEMVPAKLKVLESDQMRYEEFKRLYPSGQVLSKDTGATRFYGSDPYGSYYTSNYLVSGVSNEDDRLERKDYVLGIVIDGKAKAYLPDAIKKVGHIEDTFAGKTFVVKYEKELDVVRIFEKKFDGTLVRINPFPNFWFSWVAVHPETELYK